MIRIGIIGTNNTHAHQLSGFINGWRDEVAIPTRWRHGPLPQFYNWAKVLRELEEAGEVPALDARVTRLWSESPRTEGTLIAEACDIDDLVDSPTDATREVDAVLLLTDDPHSHLEMATPALRAGLPMFIDKPLAPDVETARRLADLAEEHNAPWFSGSAFRFSSSLNALRHTLTADVGTITAVYVQCAGWIEEYGIHALELLNVLTGHAVLDAQGMSLPGRTSVLLRLGNGVTALLETVAASPDPPGQVIVWGNRGSLHWASQDGYHSVFGLTTAFLNMVRTGMSPVPVAESLELARLAQTLIDSARRHPR